MEDYVILNHCKPYRENGGCKVEIKADDGLTYNALWYDERISPSTLPDDKAAFYLRYNGESLYTYLIYDTPRASDFAATLIVDKKSDAYKAFKESIVVEV